MAPSSLKMVATSLKQLCSRLRRGKANSKHIDKLSISSPVLVQDGESVSQAAAVIIEQELSPFLLNEATLPPPSLPFLNGKTQVRAELPAASSIQRQPRVKVIRRKTQLSSIHSSHFNGKEQQRATTPSENLLTASAPPSPTSSDSSFAPSPIFDSPSRFRTTIAASSPAPSHHDFTSTSDDVEDILGRLFDSNCATPMQSILPVDLNPTTAFLSTLFGGISPSCSINSLSSLASLGDDISSAEQSLVRSEVFNSRATVSSTAALHSEVAFRTVTGQSSDEEDISALLEEDCEDLLGIQLPSFDSSSTLSSFDCTIFRPVAIRCPRPCKIEELETPAFLEWSDAELAVYLPAPRRPLPRLPFGGVLCALRLVGRESLS